jgi:hypothetical protein
MDDARQIAQLMPVHDVGETPVPAGGWVTRWDALAWHEGTHAVVNGTAGWPVDLVTIDSTRVPSGAHGTCHAPPPPGLDPLLVAHVRAVGALAGMIGARTVLVGLDLAHATTEAAKLTSADIAVFAAARTAIHGPGVVPGFAASCAVCARRILFEHRGLYGANVRALLERRTLDVEAVAELIAGP